MSENNNLDSYFVKGPKNESEGNRFFTPEEWFIKYYNGQKDEQLPENIFKDISPEIIKDLREKYISQAPKIKQTIEDIQLDLFKE